MTPAEETAELTLPDGRTLSYAAFGPSGGPLVVVLDGPGSRGLARAAAPAAEQLGLRLVAPDRPGFFGSTAADRQIADWPEDHAALLDALGVREAGILGQSGGTPFALAAAAALPDRVRGLALLGGLAPLSDPDALAEAGKQLRTGAKLARRAPWLLRLGLRSAGRSAQKDPEKAARKAAKDLPAADAQAMEDPDLWQLHVDATREILGQPDAIATEIGLFIRPWNIDLGAIAVPVALWTGECDQAHPPAHARRLAEALGGAPVTIVPQAATFGLLPIYPDALRAAAELPAPAFAPAS